MDKVYFVIYHYSILGLIIFSAYGLGTPLIQSVFERYNLPKIMESVFAIVSGLAVAMVLLFMAGMVGFLNKYTVLILLFTGGAFTVFSILSLIAKNKKYSRKNEQLALLNRIPWWSIGIIGAFFFHYLIRVLQPGTGWDGAMYHLPYARFWAEQGGLIVNEWLRYPLFAQNMHLLYAASLVFDNEVLPKVFHGFSIALTTMLTYYFARLYMNARVAVIAVVLLLIATAWGWSYVYVDMGLMLFWSAAFFALALRYQYGDWRFSYLAALFAGIAIGIKYQGLFYLPIFAILAFFIEQRISVFLKSFVIFILIGGYWYIRNFLLSGDPINPIGGEIFGFSYWDPGDLLLQFDDFDGRRELPPWYLSLAIGAIFFWRSSTPIQKVLIVSTFGCFVVWASVAQYMRYFVSIYPMLALLSAFFLERLLGRLGVTYWIMNVFKSRSILIRKTIISSFLIVALSYGLINSQKEVERITTNGNFHERGGTGTTLLRSINFQSDGGLYQLGFENEIYYLYSLTDKVRGDHFGPGRYRDIKQVANDAPALVKHLKRLGVNSLLINVGRPEFANWPWDPNLLKYFDLVTKSDQAILYKIKDGV